MFFKLKNFKKKQVYNNKKKKWLKNTTQNEEYRNKLAYLGYKDIPY